MARPFSTVTPLGQMMKSAGLRVADVDYITGISYRTLSDYLAGRVTIPQRHLTKLCALFQCDAEDLLSSGSESLEDQHA